MPRKPLLDDTPVDLDDFEDLEEDDLPDEPELQDLQDDLPDLSDFEGDDEDDDGDIPPLPEDEALAVEAPLTSDDTEDEIDIDFDEPAVLDANDDWVALANDLSPHELPVLTWRQMVPVKELGRTPYAELDPTSEATTWFRGESPGPAHHLTLVLGGLEVRAFPAVMNSDREWLRIGRDILANRFLVNAT